MDYVERKQAMYNLLEKVLKKSDTGLSEAELIYLITNELAVSELAIKRRIELLRTLDKVDYDLSTEAYKWRK